MARRAGRIVAKAHAMIRTAESKQDELVWVVARQAVALAVEDAVGGGESFDMAGLSACALGEGQGRLKGVESVTDAQLY